MGLKYVPMDTILIIFHHENDSSVCFPKIKRGSHFRRRRQDNCLSFPNLDVVLLFAVVVVVA